MKTKHTRSNKNYIMQPVYFVADAYLFIYIPLTIMENKRLLNYICFMFFIVLAPHLGSATEKTRDAMALLAVDNILAALDGTEMPAPL